MTERNFAKFAPVSAEERRAALSGEPAKSPALSPSSDKPARRARKAPKSAPPAPDEDAPRFVGGALRRLTIPLVCPIEYRGKVYSAITLRRPLARDVGEYFERLAVDPEQTIPFPIFLDDEGHDVPAKVIDSLDDEDDEVVMKAAQDFLSPRLLAMRARQ